MAVALLLPGGAVALALWGVWRLVRGGEHFHRRMWLDSHKGERWDEK